MQLVVTDVGQSILMSQFRHGVVTALLLNDDKFVFASPCRMTDQHRDTIVDASVGRATKEKDVGGISFSEKQRCSPRSPCLRVLTNARVLWSTCCQERTCAQVVCLHKILFHNLFPSCFISWDVDPPEIVTVAKRKLFTISDTWAYVGFNDVTQTQTGLT